MERYRYLTKMVILRAIRSQAEDYFKLSQRAYAIFVYSNDYSRGAHAYQLSEKFHKKAGQLFLIEKILITHWPEHDTLSVIRGLLE